MARKQHKYHYIYRTTCKVTGRYYIGMHSTDNLEDNYIGSGRILWLSINKHGKENHYTEILEFLESREALKNREIQLVNEDILKDSMCMNLMKGGDGGFISKEQQAKRSSTGGNARANHMKNDSDFSRLVADKISKAITKRVKSGIHLSWKNNYSWIGKKHTDETKQKMKESHRNHGIKEKNSQYGTKWITNGFDNKKIKAIDQTPINWWDGRIIKRRVAGAG